MWPGSIASVDNAEPGDGGVAAPRCRRPRLDRDLPPLALAGRLMILVDRVDGEIAKFRRALRSIAGAGLILATTCRLAGEASVAQVIWLIGSVAALAAGPYRAGTHAPFSQQVVAHLSLPKVGTRGIGDEGERLTGGAARFDRSDCSDAAGSSPRSRPIDRLVWWSCIDPDVVPYDRDPPAGGDGDGDSYRERRQPRSRFSSPYRSFRSAHKDPTGRQPIVEPSPQKRLAWGSF